MIAPASPAAPAAARRARAAGAPPRVPPDAVGVAAVVGLAVLVTGFGVLGLGPFPGGGTTRLDTMLFFQPWFTVLGERLRAGDIPAWNPHPFGGVPFAGDPESGWMYLPAMLLFVALPPMAAMHAYALVHLLLAGLGAYALGRRLGFGVPAATVAGAAYLCSAPMEFLRCCTTRAQVAAWIPLAFLGVHLAMRPGRPAVRLGGVAAAGLAVSQVLAGWLGQGAYYALLAVGAWVAYLMLDPGPAPAAAASWRARLRDGVLVGAAVLALGFGLAAAGVLPRVEAVDRSNLAGGAYEGAAEGAGDTGGWLIRLAVDRFVSYDGGSDRHYAGGAVLALAGLGLVLTRRRFAAPFFVLLVGLAFLLATRETAVHRLFYLLPRFETLHEHVPSRVLMVAPIGLAMLAGATVEACLGAARRTRVLLAVTLLPAAGFALLVRYLDDRNRELGAATLVAAGAAVLALAAMTAAGTPPRLAGARHRVERAAVGLVVLVVFLDPTGVGMYRSEHPSLPAPRQELVPSAATRAGTVDAAAAYADGEDRGGAGEFLRAQRGAGPFRFASYDMIDRTGHGDRFARGVAYRGLFDDPAVQRLLANNRALTLGLQDIQGYNPIQPARYVAFMEALNGSAQEYHESTVLPTGLQSPLLPALNLRYLVVPAEAPPGRPDLLHLGQRFPTVFADGRVRVVEHPAALPRAWLVHRARQTTAEDALRLLAAGEVDPRQEALLETAPPPLAAPADPAADRVVVTDYAGDRIRLSVATDAPGLLVLSEIYDPGWTARVDGDPAPVLPADGALRAVPVPAGAHAVELRYEPRSLRLGLAITGGTAAVFLLAGVLLLIRARAGGLRPAWGGRGRSFPGHGPGAARSEAPQVPGPRSAKLPP